MAWNNGWYSSGLDVRDGMDRMAKIVSLLGWSREFYQEERWKSVLGMSSLDDFINGVMKAYFEPMDPNVPFAKCTNGEVQMLVATKVVISLKL